MIMLISNLHLVAITLIGDRSNAVRPIAYQNEEKNIWISTTYKYDVHDNAHFWT